MKAKYERTSKMKYAIAKDKARDIARGYQIDMSENSYGYRKIVEIHNILHKLGKRYGLIKEFKENGLL